MEFTFRMDNFVRPCQQVIMGGKEANLFAFGRSASAYFEFFLNLLTKIRKQCCWHFGPTDLDNFCLIQRKICTIGGLYKPIEKSHKPIIPFNPFIQISHIFFTPEYTSNKMATFLSFHKNALTKLFVVLLAILLIQQHVVQVDGQMCDPRMFSKCLTKIYIYTFSACPEGKYCSWFWCYDCLKNGAGVYNYKGLNSIPGCFQFVKINLLIVRCDCK